MAASKKRSRTRVSAENGEAETPAAEPRVDAVLGELEQVVSDLEGGELPLEQALRRFEEGVKLARTGGGLLDAMEQRVEVLLRDGNTAPFDHDGSDDHE